MYPEYNWDAGMGKEREDESGERVCKRASLNKVDTSFACRVVGVLIGVVSFTERSSISFKVESGMVGPTSAGSGG